MDATEMGRRLRAARQKAGLTQCDAADALGLHRNALSAWESGRQAGSVVDVVRLVHLYRERCPEIDPATIFEVVDQ